MDVIFKEGMLYLQGVKFGKVSLMVIQLFCYSAAIVLSVKILGHTDHY